jgi:hypothetical protein
LKGVHDCTKTHKRKPKVANLNVFANLHEVLCPTIQFLGHTMNLREGPALAANHKEFKNGLLESIYIFFPLLLEEIASVVSRQQKKFQEQWTESEIAIEFLNSLRELCKSKNVEETDSRLSTCFEKLLKLFKYIRPYHFVVGVETGQSFNDVLKSDTIFTLKNGVQLEAQVERNSFLLNAVGGIHQKVCSLAFSTTKLKAGQTIDMGPEFRAFCSADCVFERGNHISKTNLTVIRTSATVLFETCYCLTPCENAKCTSKTEGTRLRLKLHYNTRQQDEYRVRTIHPVQIQPRSQRHN